MRLLVKIRSDGHPSLVAVQSGPPMLRQAAEDSAKASLFEVIQQDSKADSVLIYRFELHVMECHEERNPSYPRVKYEGNVVDVEGQAVPLCQAVAVKERIRFRSAKCLFLWKCGSEAP